MLRFYNPLHESNSRFILLNNYSAGAKSFYAQKKSIIDIMNGFTKKNSNYPYDTLKDSIKDPILFNIYDLRDLIVRSDLNHNLETFLSYLPPRISLLSKDADFSYSTKTIFSSSSYPVVVTYKIVEKDLSDISNKNKNKHKLTYVLEKYDTTPNKSKQNNIEKQPIPTDMVYIYSQLKTYIISVSKSHAMIDNYKYIDTKSDTIQFKDIGMNTEIEATVDYKPVLVNDLINAVKENKEFNIYNFNLS